MKERHNHCYLFINNTFSNDANEGILPGKGGRMGVVFVVGVALVTALSTGSITGIDYVRDYYVLW